MGILVKICNSTGLVPESMHESGRLTHSCGFRKFSPFRSGILFEGVRHDCGVWVFSARFRDEVGLVAPSGSVISNFSSLAFLLRFGRGSGYLGGGAQLPPGARLETVVVG